MKLMWLGYLVYSLSNCVMKLCIETGLRALTMQTLLQSLKLFITSNNVDLEFKTWSLIFSTYFFNKYTATSAKYHK